jgi:hypothetical protein
MNYSHVRLATVFLSLGFTFVAPPGFAAASVAVLPRSSRAAPAPLFQKNIESFQIVDFQSKPITLKILNSSLTKQTLAMALNSAWELSGPGGESKPYVELRLQKIIFTLLKDHPEQLHVTLQASGRLFELENPISKGDFVAGKRIAVTLPPSDKTILAFSVRAKGDFAIQYQRSDNSLLIDKAVAQLEIENPLLPDESERIEFRGKGIRQ